MLRNERLNSEKKKLPLCQCNNKRCHKGKGEVPIPAMKTCRVPGGGQQFVNKKYSGLYSYCHVHSCTTLQEFARFLVIPFGKFLVFFFFNFLKIN